MDSTRSNVLRRGMMRTCIVIHDEWRRRARYGYTSTLERERPPTYYVLLAQNYESGVALHVRAASNPMSLVPAIREAVRQVDSTIGLFQGPQYTRNMLTFNPG